MIVSALAAIATFFVVRHREFPRRSLLIADAFGLALFTVIGLEKALNNGAPALTAALLGVMTGTGGGMIRDVLARQIPLIFRHEIYATASFAGAGCYLLLAETSLPTLAIILISTMITLGLRLASIKWKWSLPVFRDRAER